MKILNLYAGIGGNRKLWSDEHEITASKVGKMVMFSTNGKGYFTVNKGNIFTLFGR